MPQDEFGQQEVPFRVDADEVPVEDQRAGAPPLGRPLLREAAAGGGVGGGDGAPPAISGSGEFKGNTGGGDGLNISATGAVTLNNLTAVSNTGFGVSVTNTLLAPPAAYAVTINGVNNFSNTIGGSGLAIISRGGITLNNITANGNASAGATLTNVGPAQSPVKVNGYGTFEANLSYGLIVTSNGAVTAKNLKANLNGDSGAFISTMGISAPRAVTLTGVNNFNFNGNAAGETGLIVYADGNITISNLTASYNWTNGAVLDNFTNWDAHPDPNFATFGSITLTGFANFTNNSRGTGLTIKTHGNVTLNRAAADLNGDAVHGASDYDSGIYIMADGKVTLVCSSAYGNNQYGLHVRSANDLGNAGLITLKGWSVFSNGTNEDLHSSLPVTRLPCP